MTLETFLQEWHAGREPLLQRSTFEAEGIYLDRHIIPYFREHAAELETLTAPQVLGYMQSKLKGGRMDGKTGGLSRVSVRKHMNILRQALNDATMLGYISHNPAQAVRLPRAQRDTTERTVFLTSEDAQRLIDGFRGHELYSVVVLTLYYGLRRSEVLGLRWEAVDFMRGTLTINHTIVKNLSIEAKDSTKSDTSRRTFQLLPEVTDMLRELHGDRFTHSPYIFHRADGTPLRPDYVTRAFSRQLDCIGLPHMRFHDLRHSTASILFDRGWSLEDVKNWMGHADIETTSNIYLHYSRARRVLLSGKLRGMFTIEKTKKSP